MTIRVAGPSELEPFQGKSQHLGRVAAEVDAQEHHQSKETLVLTCIIAKTHHNSPLSFNHRIVIKR